MDIRSDSKGYEEFLQKTIEEEGLLYLRGRVSRIYQDDGKVRVSGVDTLTGKMVEVPPIWWSLPPPRPEPWRERPGGQTEGTVDKHGF